MISSPVKKSIHPVWYGLILVLALALAGCGTPVDETLGSRLTQSADPQAQVATNVGDIAIAGQEVAKVIRNYPDVAAAKVPPLIEFKGVTSIVNGPIPVDTEPYSVLLRDRLLVGAHEKVRYIEPQLPQLDFSSSKKGKKAATPRVVSMPDPQYQVLAELHGSYGADFYKIQIQFVDYHTGAVLFNGLYQIRPEVQAPPPTALPVPPAPEVDAAGMPVAPAVPGTVPVNDNSDPGTHP